MQIAIVLYPGLTALDAIGPYEVLRHLPDAEVRFVGAAPRTGRLAARARQGPQAEGSVMRGVR
jgi:putative intracellular protease/amidase